MTDTPIDTVNGLKRTHAQEVIDALQGISNLIGSKPDLWFGGLPPILAQAIQQTEFHISRIRDDFGIEVVPQAST